MVARYSVPSIRVYSWIYLPMPVYSGARRVDRQEYVFGRRWRIAFPVLWNPLFGCIFFFCLIDEEILHLKENYRCEYWEIFSLLRVSESEEEWRRERKACDGISFEFRVIDDGYWFVTLNKRISFRKRKKKICRLSSLATTKACWDL